MFTNSSKLSLKLTTLTSKIKNTCTLNWVKLNKTIFLACLYSNCLNILISLFSTNCYIVNMEKMLTDPHELVVHCDWCLELY